MAAPGSPQRDLQRLHLLFAASSLALLAVFLVSVWHDYDREWKRHQKEFRTLDASRAKDPAAKERALARKISIQQYWLEDLVVEPRDSRGVPERCISCHVAWDRPTFADAPNPFKAHPGLGGWFSKHEIDKMGCVVCHAGQGPATDAHAAHGPIKHWLEPMRRGGLIQASCVQCHALSEEIPGLETLRKGVALAAKFKCNVCHKVSGEGGSIGPELVDVHKKVDTSTGVLHELEWHRKHFKDPRSTSDDTSAMPNFKFTDEDMEAILTFVLALNTQRVTRDLWAPSLVAAKGLAIDPLPAVAIPPLPPIGQEDAGAEKAEAPTTDDVRRLRADYIVEGKKLYASSGCVACHSVNADSHHRERGKLGPDFVNLAGGEREEAWIVDFLALPPKYFPGLPMPPYAHLSMKQRRQIALYLLSPKLPEASDEPTAPLAKVLKKLIGYKKPKADANS